jgi:hypothetical protein
MANIVSSSPILVTLLMEALSSSETSVLTRGTGRNTPEYGILLQHNFQTCPFFWKDKVKPEDSHHGLSVL